MFDNIEDRLSAARNPSTTGATLALLWVALTRLPVNRMGVIKLDRANFKKGSGDDDEIRFLVGSHPNLLVETMLTIIEDQVEGNSIFGVANNPSCPPHILKLLRKWEGAQNIRRGVISNPAAPDTVRQVCYDDSELTKVMLVRNSLTRPEILASLAEDKSITVVEAVASNVRTPVHVLVRLADSGKLQILVALASNPSTPVHIAVEAFRIGVESFRPAVLQNPEIMIRFFSVGLLVELLKNDFPGVSNDLPKMWLTKLWVETKAPK